jgi:hypothetical protein
MHDLVSFFHSFEKKSRREVMREKEGRTSHEAMI